jgi:uncharacterized protein YecT (DUF1311 family)
MPPFKLSVAIATLWIAGGGAHAAPGSASPCQSAPTESDMAACFQHRLDRADAALNAAYRTLMARYKENGAPAGFTIGSQEDYLEKAQRAWTQLRDATCDFETYESMTGTGFGTLHTACLMEETQKRVDYLQRFVDSP